MKRKGGRGGPVSNLQAFLDDHRVGFVEEFKAISERRFEAAWEEVAGSRSAFFPELSARNVPMKPCVRRQHQLAR